MKEKTIRAMLELEQVLDTEKKKLYDTQKDKDLSYNRKKKLLKQVYTYFQHENHLSQNYKTKLIEKIKNELENPYYRHYWRVKCSN